MGERHESTPRRAVFSLVQDGRGVSPIGRAAGPSCKGGAGFRKPNWLMYGRQLERGGRRQADSRTTQGLDGRCTRPRRWRTFQGDTNSPRNHLPRPTKRQGRPTWGRGKRVRSPDLPGPQGRSNRFAEHERFRPGSGAFQAELTVRGPQGRRLQGRVRGGRAESGDAARHDRMAPAAAVGVGLLLVVLGMSSRLRRAPSADQ